MDTPSIPLKQCSCKDKCVNPFGSWLPATLEHFYKDKHTTDGLSRYCRLCCRAKTRKYAAENPDKIKASNQRYYQNNKELHDAKSLQYFKDHPEVKKAIEARYRRNHSDKCNESNQRWLNKNPEKKREYSQRRKARKQNAVGQFNAEDIQTLYVSQQGKCWWCECELNGKYEIDHRIPLSRGGTNNANNLCLTCRTCNRSKNDKLPHEWNGRLL